MPRDAFSALLTEAVVHVANLFSELVGWLIVDGEVGATAVRRTGRLVRARSRPDDEPEPEPEPEVEEDDPDDEGALEGAVAVLARPSRLPDWLERMATHYQHRSEAVIERVVPPGSELVCVELDTQAHDAREAAAWFMDNHALADALAKMHNRGWRVLHAMETDDGNLLLVVELLSARRAMAARVDAISNALAAAATSAQDDGDDEEEEEDQVEVEPPFLLHCPERRRSLWRQCFRQRKMP